MALALLVQATSRPGPGAEETSIPVEIAFWQLPERAPDDLPQSVEPEAEPTPTEPNRLENASDRTLPEPDIREPNVPDPPAPPEPALPEPVEPVLPPPNSPGPPADAPRDRAAARQAVASPRPHTAARPAAPRGAVAPAAASSITPASAPPASSPISPNWQAAIAAWLQRHKSYPDAARARGEQGTAQVSFKVTRDGTVSAVHLLSGTGSAVLDEAVRAMLTNARVPPFPTDMTQPSVTVNVRIAYRLDR